MYKRKDERDKMTRHGEKRVWGQKFYRTEGTDNSTEYRRRMSKLLSSAAFAPVSRMNLSTSSS